MGYFEQNPWLLIPAVIVIVELWNALKAAFIHALAARRRRPMARE